MIVRALKTLPGWSELELYDCSFGLEPLTAASRPPRHDRVRTRFDVSRPRATKREPVSGALDEIRSWA
jgi:hypothetical protein